MREQLGNLSDLQLVTWEGGGGGGGGTYSERLRFSHLTRFVTALVHRISLTAVNRTANTSSSFLNEVQVQVNFIV